jgi:hypothetical protein
MATRKFAIKPNTWKKMRQFKDNLNEKNGTIVPWDLAFSKLMKIWEIKKKTSSKSLKAPSPPPSPPKTPSNSQISTPSPSRYTPSVLSSQKTKQNIREELQIPKVPMKDPIHIKVSKKQLQQVKKKETQSTKYVLVECPICGKDKPIIMPIPKDLVQKSKKPVVDVSFVHGNPPHVVVAQLDHDFQVRRRRSSWVVFEKDFKKH